MNLVIRRLLVCAPLAVTAAGCGALRDDKDSVESGPLDGSDATGLWGNECLNDNGDSEREYLDVSGDSVTYIFRSFGLDGCREGDVNVERRTVYRYVSEVRPAAIEGWTTLRTEVRENSLTFKTRDAVDWANGRNWYGYNDWEVNKPKDLSGRRAKPGDESSQVKTAVGDTRYVSYTLEGGDLLTPDYSSGVALRSDKPEDRFKRL